jgi:O-antigen ligase
MRSLWGKILAVAVVVATLLAGAGVAARPAVLGLALAPLLLAVLARWSVARLTWFILGGLAVFQGDGIGASKLGYLAGVVLVAIFSTVRVARSRAQWLEPFRPILTAAGITFAGLLCSLLIAHGQANTTDSIRDILPYLLLAVAPIIGLDAAHELGDYEVAKVIGVIGVFAAVGFTLDWLNRRGVSALPVGRVFLASQILAGFGFAYCIGMAAAGRHWARWSACCAFIPLVLLLAGTRTTLILAVAVLGVIGSRRKRRVGLVRVLILAVGGVGLLVFLVPRLITLVVSNPRFFESRIHATGSVLDGRAGTDGSYVLRQASYERALAVWQQHRWLGTGPGHLYDGGFTGDSPLFTLAKFGLVGTAILLCFLAVLVITSTRAGKRFGWSPAHTGMRAFVLVFLATLPFGSPLEDKGMSFVVALSMCAVAAAARERDRVQRSAELPMGTDSALPIQTAA